MLLSAGTTLKSPRHFPFMHITSNEKIYCLILLLALPSSQPFCPAQTRLCLAYRLRANLANPSHGVHLGRGRNGLQRLAHFIYFGGLCGGPPQSRHFRQGGLLGGLYRRVQSAQPRTPDHAKWRHPIIQVKCLLNFALIWGITPSGNVPFSCLLQAATVCTTFFTFEKAIKLGMQ